MPTFSAIELDNWVESRDRDSYNNNPPPQRTKHIFISPAFYVTPEPAPIPDSAADPSSPSPYVVNHKRRGGGSGGGFGNRRSGGGHMDVFGGSATEAADGVSCGGENEPSVRKEKEEEEEVEEFLDSKFDSGSIRIDNTQQLDCRSFSSSNHGEFFDAIEDFSSGSPGSVSNAAFSRNLESELRSLRLCLLEEIEKCKDAEDALDSMHLQWQRISDLLSEFGVKLPMISNSSGDVQLENEDGSIEDLSQKLGVCRYVANAFGKAEARVEAELAAEAILKSKDQEISRLRDRLQYYEAVNREMTQRNQEIIEVGRKQRQKRKSRLLWSCVGASAAIGISVLAYAYTGRRQELPSRSSSDTSSSSP